MAIIPKHKFVKILFLLMAVAVMITIVGLTTESKAATLDIIHTVAGTGSFGYSGDGGPPTEAQLRQPYDVAIDSAGNLYLADTSNNCIRMVPAANGTYFGMAMTAGNIYTVAGTGTSGYAGDGGPATAAQLYQPYGVTIDTGGNLYIADWYNNRIRKVNTGGIITTVAGNGTPGYSGDGGAATGAKLYRPQKVAVDSTGNLYIADAFNHRIRMVPAADGTHFGIAMTAGNIYTVAGTGTSGYSGDGGPATAARLYFPGGLAVNSTGSLFIADATNQRIRKVDTGGTITTVAGTGTAGYSGDGEAATSAQIYGPQGMTLDSAGNIYIADTNNHCIRFIEFQAITLPLWAGTYPKAGTLDKTSIEILVQTDEDGAAYFVALPYEAPAPTSAQVKAGLDASGTPVAANLKGTVALAANTEASFSATSLNAQTFYDFYVVAEENSGPNLQQAPVKVRVMTQKVDWIGADSCPDCHGITPGDFDLASIDRNTICITCHDNSLKPFGSHVDLTLSAGSLNADAGTVHPPHDGTGASCEPCHTVTTTCTVCHGSVPHEQHGSSEIAPVTVPYGFSTQEITCGNSSCHQTLAQGVQSGACTNCHTVGKEGHTAAPRTHSDFEANTAACAGCHVTHAAPGPKLMRTVTQNELCYLCHGAGATASPYDVQQGLTYNPTAAAWQPSSAGGFSQTGGASSTSIHNVEGYGMANQTAYDAGLAGFTGTIPGGSSSLTGRGLQCSSCHQPHGGTGNARLLRNSFFNGAADKQVRMTTGSNMVVSYDQGFSEWCAACHERFNAGPGSGHTAVEFNGKDVYRHSMNVQVGTIEFVSDRSFNGTPLQSGKRTGTTTDDNMVVCVTCHRSHGTSATVTGAIANWQRDTGESGSGSALLRMNNRDVCVNCHGTNPSDKPITEVRWSGKPGYYDASTYGTVYLYGWDGSSWVELASHEKWAFSNEVVNTVPFGKITQIKMRLAGSDLSWPNPGWVEVSQVTASGETAYPSNLYLTASESSQDLYSGIWSYGGPTGYVDRITSVKWRLSTYFPWDANYGYVYGWNGSSWVQMDKWQGTWDRQLDSSSWGRITKLKVRLNTVNYDPPDVDYVEAYQATVSGSQTVAVSGLYLETTEGGQDLWSDEWVIP